MTEVEAAHRIEREATEWRAAKKRQKEDARVVEDSGTETEGGGAQSEEMVSGRLSGSKTAGLLKPDDAQGALRKRSVSAEASSGELSTDSDWDKVSEAEGGG